MTWKLHEIKAIIRTEHPGAHGDLKPCALTRTLGDNGSTFHRCTAYTMPVKAVTSEFYGDGYIAAIVDNTEQPARLWVSRSARATRGAAVADASERRSGVRPKC